MTAVGSATAVQQNYTPNTDVARNGACDEEGVQCYHGHPGVGPKVVGEGKVGSGYLGKSTPEWNNKALTSLNQNFGRGTFKDGNRSASVEYIGGAPRLVIKNDAIKGKAVDTAIQYVKLVKNDDGTFRQASALDNMQQKLGAPNSAN